MHIAQSWWWYARFHTDVHTRTRAHVHTQSCSYMHSRDHAHVNLISCHWYCTVSHTWPKAMSSCTRCGGRNGRARGPERACQKKRTKEIKDCVNRSCVLPVEHAISFRTALCSSHHDHRLLAPYANHVSAISAIHATNAYGYECLFNTYFSGSRHVTANFSMSPLFCYLCIHTAHSIHWRASFRAHRAKAEKPKRRRDLHLWVSSCTFRTGWE